MTEPDGVMRKRLAIRAWRRGTKEMDLLLGLYADAHLTGLSGQALAAFAALLEEDDDTLTRWALGTTPTPATHADLMTAICDFAARRQRG